MAAVEAHEAALFARLLDGLAKLGDVTLYGKAARRAPTAFFNVGAVDPGGGGRAPGRRAASTCGTATTTPTSSASALGLESDGAVRAGIVHYNDASDVDRLLAGVAEMAAALTAGSTAGDASDGQPGATTLCVVTRSWPSGGG